MLNAIASSAHGIAWIDFWGYSNILPFWAMSFLKAVTASTLIAIPAVFITQAIKILVPAGYETESRAARLGAVSSILIPLSILVEVGLSFLECLIGERSSSYSGSFDGTVNFLKSAVNGLIYIYYLSLSLHYGFVLTYALKRSKTVNRGGSGSGASAYRSSASEEERDSAGIGGSASVTVRRWFCFGGMGMLLGAAYKFRSIFFYYGKTVYYLPPCRAFYFDVVAFIFITCQVFFLIAQASSYWAVLRRKEASRTRRGKLVNLRGSGNGRGSSGGFYRAHTGAAQPLLEGCEENAKSDDDEEEEGSCSEAV